MKIIGLLETPTSLQLSRYVDQGILLVPIKEISLEDRTKVAALFTKVSVKASLEILELFPNLSIIGVPATAIDNIDTNYCKAKKIKVISLRHRKFAKRLVHFTSTSEIFFWHLLNLVRNCERASLSVRRGEWDRNKFIGKNLGDLTLGVLGFGRIGRQIANIGNTLGMNVIYFDLMPSCSKVQKFKSVDNLTDLISKSNVLSINVNHSQENSKIINAAALGSVSKKPFYIINTSRGSIVDESVILAALINSTIDGYGTDVLEGELSKDTNWLFENKLWQTFQSEKYNISLTPHIGGATFPNIKSSEEFIFEELVNEIGEDNEST